MTVRLAMKFTEALISDVQHLVEDDQVVFEQKLDGTRVLAVVTKGHVRYLHSGGGTLAHSAATQWLPEITEALRPVQTSLLVDDEIVLDGELMIRTGEYLLFDLPYMKINGATLVTPADPFDIRRATLETPELLRTLAGTLVSVVRQARGADEKAALVEAVRAEGGEGIMAKRLSGRYVPGTRVKHAVKLKFTYSVDVVVMEVNRPDAKHGSLVLGAFDAEGRLVKVGACSAIGKPYVEVGDVIECVILYWTGSSLYQPRMVRVREDKTARQEDCSMDQFKIYSREVV